MPRAVMETDYPFNQGLGSLLSINQNQQTGPTHSEVYSAGNKHTQAQTNSVVVGAR